jgi:hypothetical protein
MRTRRAQTNKGYSDNLVCKKEAREHIMQRARRDACLVEAPQAHWTNSTPARQ